MIDIFADGADIAAITQLASDPTIKGFTTNPSLMRASGVTDYEAFAREAVSIIGARPISFEVLTDDLASMEVEAHTIHRWGEHIFVKVPITTSTGISTLPLISRLNRAGVKLNVTALLSLDQVRSVSVMLTADTPSFVSVFAGRIADTGRDPVPLMAAAVKVLARAAWYSRLIWASPREVLNIHHASIAGCPIITMTPQLLAKRALFGKSLDEYSLETVQMFARDAQASGLSVLRSAV